MMTWPRVLLALLVLGIACTGGAPAAPRPPAGAKELPPPGAGRRTCLQPRWCGARRRWISRGHFLERGKRRASWPDRQPAAAHAIARVLARWFPPRRRLRNARPDG